MNLDILMPLLFSFIPVVVSQRQKVANMGDDKYLGLSVCQSGPLV